MKQDEYQPQETEHKWRARWAERNSHKTGNAPDKPKYYCLDMFPYPSGDGLHVGHWRGYVMSDVWSRYKKLQGYNVLHPMGWDAFGLPAENDAIKKGIHPSVSAKRNIDNFRRQLTEMGAMYDWDREVNTSDPGFYKFTQWIFLQMYKHGLAYRKEMPINWCPSCKTGLANEEVVHGRCERCDSEITKRPMLQWMLRITRYADRLQDDLARLDWPDQVRKMQSNWIGRSDGVEIRFPVVESDCFLTAFTTRADTIFGVTFLVIAPEHPLAMTLTKQEFQEDVSRYAAEAMRKSNIERMTCKVEKNGVFTGSYAINPIQGEPLPIWISDYVLTDYATGAIMGVPSHDPRDFAFAQAMGLPVRPVVVPYGCENPRNAPVFTEPGVLVDSGCYTGMDSGQAKAAITADLCSSGHGEAKTHYKLRDWVFSRQRYWGEPIPIIHCKHCGEVPVPEADLPVRLPFVEKYEPSGTGESPLAKMEAWVHTVCPTCGEPATRETNTMPQWAGSSWYFLRYCDPKNTELPFDKQKVQYWQPVDFYIGGNEHAVLHLLYARFYTKFLNDIGLISFDEPFTRLFNIGMICKDGYKMSKSKPNCVSSDLIVREYGTDTLRLYEMFIGPTEQDAEWVDTGISGVFRFLSKIWTIAMNSLEHNPSPSDEVTKATRQLIHGVTERLQAQKINTVISQLMEYAGYIGKHHPTGLDREHLGKLITLLAPFAPHLAEEIWERMGNTESIFESGHWPEVDPEDILETEIEIPVQINGKVRGSITVDRNAEKVDVIRLAKECGTICNYLASRRIVKEIYVPQKIINFVTADNARNI